PPRVGVERREAAHLRRVVDDAVLHGDGRAERLARVLAEHGLLDLTARDPGGPLELAGLGVEGRGVAVDEALDRERRREADAVLGHGRAGEARLLEARAGEDVLVVPRPAPALEVEAGELSLGDADLDRNAAERLLVLDAVDVGRHEDAALDRRAELDVRVVVVVAAGRRELGDVLRPLEP